MKSITIFSFTLRKIIGVNKKSTLQLFVSSQKKEHSQQLYHAQNGHHKIIVVRASLQRTPLHFLSHLVKEIILVKEDSHLRGETNLQKLTTPKELDSTTRRNLQYTNNMTCLGIQTQPLLIKHLVQSLVKNTLFSNKYNLIINHMPF